MHWLDADPPADRRKAWLWARWKARTDLIWLCNHVLDYPDVSQRLHGNLIDRMQKFPKPNTIEVAEQYDAWNEEIEGWDYTPILMAKKFAPKRLPDPRQFPGHKKRLILDSRGFLKTSINIKAHTIQWLLNYPDVSIILFQSNSDKISIVTKSLKAFFQEKETFRGLFPEYCPPKTMKEWGNASEFTVLARTPGQSFDMPSVLGLSLGSRTAGLHSEVVKYTDIVDEQNSAKQELCEAVAESFDMSENLLISPMYWQDMEGTIYSFADVYNRTIEREKKRQQVKLAWKVKGKWYVDKAEADREAEKYGLKPIIGRDVYIRDEKKRLWSVYINGCWERDYQAYGKPATYDYDDLDCPPKREPETGHEISRWPEQAPWDSLDSKRTANPYLFACQQLNNPTAAEEAAVFPMAQFPKLLMLRRDFLSNIYVSYLEISLDCAMKESPNSDSTAIGVAACDSGGRTYVLEMFYGKVTGDAIVDELFRLYVKYSQNQDRIPISRVLIEISPYTLGLKTWIERRMHTEGINMNMVWIPRPSSQVKDDRIAGTLGPRYRAGDIRFVVDNDDEDYWPDSLRAVYDEFAKFPRWKKDGLDMLSDFFYEKDWYGRQRPRPSIRQIQDAAWRHKLRIGTGAPMELMGEGNTIPKYYEITGGF